MFSVCGTRRIKGIVSSANSVVTFQNLMPSRCLVLMVIGFFIADGEMTDAGTAEMGVDCQKTMDGEVWSIDGATLCR